MRHYQLCLPSSAEHIILNDDCLGCRLKTVCVPGHRSKFRTSGNPVGITAWHRCVVGHIRSLGIGLSALSTLLLGFAGRGCLLLRQLNPRFCRISHSNGSIDVSAGQ